MLLSAQPVGFWILITSTFVFFISVSSNPFGVGVARKFQEEPSREWICKAEYNVDNQFTGTTTIPLVGHQIRAQGVDKAHTRSYKCRGRTMAQSCASRMARLPHTPRILSSGDGERPASAKVDE